MKPRTDILTRFKSGEVEMAEKPISVRLPKELDNRVRALPNRTEWLRKVIEQAIDDEPEVEKLKQILRQRDRIGDKFHFRLSRASIRSLTTILCLHLNATWIRDVVTVAH